MNIDEAMDYVGESGGLKMDGCDDCVIGVAEGCSKIPLLVYDRDKIVEKFVKDGMTYEDAQEYIDFNIAGAWVGEGTPLMFSGITDE